MGIVGESDFSRADSIPRLRILAIRVVRAIQTSLLTDCGC